MSTAIHEGERWIQNQVGESDLGERNSGIVSNRIIPGAIPFIRQQTMVIVTSIDTDGFPWSSVLFGESGFLVAPDPSHMMIHLDRALIRSDDPLWLNLDRDSRIGLLLIELTTRRRLRINGQATRTDNLIRVEIEASYPNCPKYIQRRHLDPDVHVTTDEPWNTGHLLETAHRSLIERADTFFVGSAHPKQGLDASHRGGAPGFITFIDNETMHIPDYPGNSMFNTLGNLVVHPQAGLLFLDFETPRSVQVIGHTQVVLNSQITSGASRYWSFKVDAWREGPLPEAWSWNFIDASPHNPK